MICRSSSLLLLVAGIALLALRPLGADEPKDRPAAPAAPRVADLFPMAVNLEANNTPENWQDLFDRIAEVQRDVEAASKRLPYAKREQMAAVKNHRILPLAKPGLHSLWHTARHVSKAAPGPGGSYINTAVAVMPLSLTNEANKNIAQPKNQDRGGEKWDGYISKSIVVVDGSILTTSYIYDSIVIASGPIRIGGYIYNSLVISVGTEGRGGSVVDVEQGYIADSLVLGEDVAAGYVKDSIIYGKVRSESLRGADVRDFTDVEKPLRKRP